MKATRTRVCALASVATCVFFGGHFPGGATALTAQERAASAPSPAIPSGRLVLELGDPERLVFEGLHTFSAEAVRIGLLENMDFLADSHVAAPLGNYLQTLRDKVEAGYHAAGFPDAQAGVRLDSENDKILVKVSEGPRCLRAGVRVTGAKTIPVELLRRRLTEAAALRRSGQPIHLRAFAND